MIKDNNILKENFTFVKKINNVFETVYKNKDMLSCEFIEDLVDILDVLINNQADRIELNVIETLIEREKYKIQKAKDERYEKRIETYEKIIKEFSKDIIVYKAYFKKEDVSSEDIEELSNKLIEDKMKDIEILNEKKSKFKDLEKFLERNKENKVFIFSSTNDTSEYNKLMSKIIKEKKWCEELIKDFDFIGNTDCEEYKKGDNSK